MFTFFLLLQKRLSHRSMDIYQLKFKKYLTKLVSRVKVKKEENKNLKTVREKS